MTVIGHDNQIISTGAENGQHPTVTLCLTVGEAEQLLGYLRSSTYPAAHIYVGRAIGNVMDALRLALGTA